MIKIGYSSDIRKRIAAMQTGCPQTLKCVWKYYAGSIESDAKSLEKKLHRYCKKHHVRGEWYKKDCMAIIEQFSVKEKLKSDRAQIGNDIEILANSPI